MVETYIILYLKTYIILTYIIIYDVHQSLHFFNIITSCFIN